jgi:transporter family protein
MTIEAWIFPAVLALVLWGVVGFLGKITLRYLPALELVIYHAVVFLCITLLSRLYFGMPGFAPAGIALAAATGAVGTLGQMFLLFALRQGPLSKVTVIASLYPGVALLLAVIFLHEPVTLRQMAGIVLGIISIVLLTGEDKKNDIRN